MINQQKQYINNQKFVIDKLQNTQLEIRQRYDYQISMEKKNRQELAEKYQGMERDLGIKMQNAVAEANRDLGVKQRQIDQLKDQVRIATRENQ